MEDMLSKVDARDLRELLTKNWMTHDAMWFYHAIQEFGMEKANQLNLAAVESMAGIEIKRLLKILGYKKDDLDDFNKLAEFFQEAFYLIKADFMKFEMDIPEENVFTWQWQDGQCFAFEGVGRLGLIAEYKCGIMKRIEGWFKGLGIKYRAEPEVDKCRMHHEGVCTGRFIVDLSTGN